MKVETLLVDQLLVANLTHKLALLVFDVVDVLPWRRMLEKFLCLVFRGFHVGVLLVAVFVIVRLRIGRLFSCILRVCVVVVVGIVLLIGRVRAISVIDGSVKVSLVVDEWISIDKRDLGFNSHEIAGAVLLKRWILLDAQVCVLFEQDTSEGYITLLDRGFEIVA